MKILFVGTVKDTEDGNRVYRTIAVDTGKGLPESVREYADEESDLPKRTVGDEVFVSRRTYQKKDGTAGTAVEVLD
jgi:hypothetical protein